MFATLIIAAIIVIGNLVATVTLLSGALLAAGVTEDSTTTDRVWGVAMLACGTFLAVLPWIA